MIFPAVMDSALQIVAALLIFIAGYLGLIVCTILGLVITQLSTDRSGMNEAYGAKAPK